MATRSAYIFVDDSSIDSNCWYAFYLLLLAFGLRVLNLEFDVQGFFLVYWTSRVFSKCDSLAG